MAGAQYVSILEPTNRRAGYDPNSDAITACLYGAVDCTDPVLLTTAALLAAFTDPGTGYPINTTDGRLGIGPLIGRYPQDYYDGNHTGAQDPGDTAD